MIDVYRTAVEPRPPPLQQDRGHCPHCHRCARLGCTAATHPSGEHFVRVGFQQWTGIYGSPSRQTNGYRCNECGDTWK